MKKFILFAVCLFSLMTLSACMFVPLFRRSGNTSSSSSSSYSRKQSSSSKKEYSDDDYDYSSSSSSSAIEDDPYTLFNDFGKSLAALTDMQDIDKWEEFKSINLIYFEEESDRVATKKDEVRAKLGQPTSELSSGGDLWKSDNYTILIAYDENSVVMNKLITFTSSKQVESLSGISKGMSAQDVVKKLGKPRGLDVTGMFTRFVWADEDDKDYYVYFKGNKVYDTKEPN